MLCRACGEKLEEGEIRCTKCGFNNQSFLVKVNDNEVKTEEENAVSEQESMENDFSYLFALSLLVFLYLKFFVGWITNSYGGYVSEAESTSFKETIIVFLSTLPAFIIQFMSYLKYLKNKIYVNGITRLLIKLVFIYSLFMLAYSLFGIAVVMFIPIVGIIIIGILIS